MSKSSNIKWKEADKKKLSSAVRRFNTKRTKLIKIVPELEDILPQKQSVKEIKKNIKTRKDFNNKINSLERFMKKGAEKTVTTESGVVTTKYQLNELRIQHNIINQQRAKRRKEANVSTQKGTMGSIEKTHLNPKKNNSQKISKNMWDKYVKAVERQIYDSYYESKNDIYRKNYFKAVEKELGKYYANKIKKLTKNLTDEDFFKAYYAEPDLQIDFAYSEEEKKIRKQVILEKWKKYMEDLEGGLL